MAGIETLSPTLRQDLLQWCHAQATHSIVYDQTNLPAELRIGDDILIYVDGQGEVYLLDKTVENAPISFVVKETQKTFGGINLKTNEPIWIKCEELKSNELLKKRKRNIDKDNQHGKKTGVILANDYIPTKDGMMHYQVYSKLQAIPLIGSFGLRKGSRFDPYPLTESEKIQVAIDILKKLQSLHFEDQIIHGNLTGDNVYILKRVDGTFEVNFYDYEKAHTNQSSSKMESLLHEDVLKIVCTILGGLAINHPTVKARLENFINTNPKTSESYAQLLQDLESFKKVPRIGLDVFEQLELPVATANKKSFCILIYNVEDGVGDFMHAWDFANKIKEQLHAKGYKVIALVQAFRDDDPNSVASKGGKFVEDMLKGEDSPFDEFLLYKHNLRDPEDTFNKWHRDNESRLNEVLPQIAGALEVSYPNNHMRQLLDAKTHVVSCYQYGFKSPVKTANQESNPMIEAHMGLPGRENPNCPGIKLHGERTLKETERLEIINNLQNKEPKFMASLLGENTAETYFRSHHFMPGYMQTINAASAFVLSHVMAYQQDNKTCDFLLPRNVVDERTLRMLLNKAGIREDEIAFVYPDKPPSPQAKVRIFCFRINDNNDYESLYKISNDGAGCSGDNSISSVFSSNHLPFYEYKIEPIGNFYKQLLTQVTDSLENARKTNNQELIHGLEKLQEYIQFLNAFRALGSPEGSNNPLPTLPTTKEEDKLKEKEKILSPEFFAFCEKLARYQQDESLKFAWGYLRGTLQRKYNVYEHLDSCVKGSVLLTEGDEQFLKNLFIDSDLIKGFIIKGLLQPKELVELSPKALQLFTLSRVQKLFEENLLTVDILKILFAPLAERESQQKYLQSAMANYAHKMLPLRYDPEVKDLLKKSPLAAIAIQINWISQVDLLVNKNQFFKIDSSEWPKLLMQLGDFKKSFSDCCKGEHNELILRYLIETLTDTEESAKVMKGCIKKVLKDPERNKNYDEMLKSALAPKREKSQFQAKRNKEKIIFSHAVEAHPGSLKGKTPESSSLKTPDKAYLKKK